ncbi:hypothetical protein V5F41_12440 [Xanthobacter autotrophicus]|uniref:hypothetical protein n=1 Tax=Xanthobacter autotrophicus TaxID=280 RepID=UPI00372CC634
MRDDFPVVNRSRGPGLPHRRVHEIACSRCPATSTLSLTDSKGLPAHTVALKFAQRGWRVVGVGKHLCPACATDATRKPPAGRLPAPSEETAMPPKAAPKTTTPVMPARPAANDDVAAAPSLSPPSPAASSALVVCYLLIEEHYDRARKAYGSGWGDERIARETGLALTVVQERRERDFGPLVVDTTREDLEATLGVLAGEIAELTTLIRAAEQAISSAQARLRSITFAAAEVRALTARLGATPIEKAA